jgi:hypothetical protein
MRPALNHAMQICQKPVIDKSGISAKIRAKLLRTNYYMETAKKPAEPIMVKRDTIDLQTSNNIIEETGLDICAQVRAILNKDNHPFVVYPHGNQNDLNSPNYRTDKRAIIGYGGRETFPFISDPTETYRGAVGVFEDHLVYSPNGCPLHQYRDSYRFVAQAGLFHTFLIDSDFMAVVSTFSEEGRPIYLSTGMIDFSRDHAFVTTDEISLEDIAAINRT